MPASPPPPLPAAVLAQLVRSRRMTRSFDPGRPVDDDVLSRLLALARYAPTAGNARGVDLLVLTDADDRADYWGLTAPGRADPWVRGVSTAPVLVVVTGDPQTYRRRYAQPDKAGRAASWTTPWWDTDAAMAAMVLLLAAHAEGLGALWCGIPAEHQQAVRERYGVPTAHRLVGLLALGYPMPGRPSRSLRRATRRETVHRGRW